MLEQFKDKFVTPERAARVVRSGDWVDYGFGGGFPELMDRALAARRDELTDVKIRGGLVIRPRIEVVEQDPEQRAFTYHSWHIGDYERKLQSRGLVRFMPMILRFLPDMWPLCPYPSPTTAAAAAWASPTTPGAPFLNTPVPSFLRSMSICPPSRV